MAITAILDLRFKPEDAAGAPAVLRNILTDTRNFDGCLGVDVMIDTADPAHVLLVERWESAERDDAYRAWRATPDGASGLGALLTGAPVVNKYTVAIQL